MKQQVDFTRLCNINVLAESLVEKTVLNISHYFEKFAPLRRMAAVVSKNLQPITMVRKENVH